MATRKKKAKQKKGPHKWKKTTNKVNLFEKEGKQLKERWQTSVQNEAGKWKGKKKQASGKNKEGKWTKERKCHTER